MCRMDDAHHRFHCEFAVGLVVESSNYLAWVEGFGSVLIVTCSFSCEGLPLNESRVVPMNTAVAPAPLSPTDAMICWTSRSS